MARYILSYAGSGNPQSKDLESIRNTKDVTVVDDSIDSVVLVEGTHHSVSTLVDSLGDWSSSPQQTVSLPNARPKILRKPQ